MKAQFEKAPGGVLLKQAQSFSSGLKEQSPAGYTQPRRAFVLSSRGL